MDTTAVAVIAVSVAVVVALIATIYCCCKRCCRRREQDGAPTRQVDLHGMHRGEAVEKVKNELEKKKRAYRKGKGGRFFDIITGRGKHSPNGQPVLRPAIEGYLDRTGHRHYRENPGMVRVDLGQC